MPGDVSPLTLGLLPYLRDKVIDPQLLGYEFSRRSKSPHDWAEVEAILARAGVTGEQFLAMYAADDEAFYELAEAVAAKMTADEREDFGARIRGHLAEDAPTWAYIDYESYVRPNEWLVHFSDHAETVSAEGFEGDDPDPTRLGLTHHLPEEDRAALGYAFAFYANSRDAQNAYRSGKYGHDCVLFKSVGVMGYHYGDEEGQVIVWGPSVSPDSMVFLRNCEQVEHKDGRVLFRGGDYDDALEWVMTNYDQYRRVLAEVSSPRHPNTYDDSDMFKLAADGHPHTSVPEPPLRTNEQSMQLHELGGTTYRDIAKNWGSVEPGSTPNLKHYDYTPHEQAIDEIIRDAGYEVYIAGGKYGKPDLESRNYNTGHLMIYDPTPGEGGDFGDETYTRTWRKIHELAHAETYKQLNEKYGEARRIGRLGAHRTLADAKRSVEWEWLAGHRQRELSAQVGLTVPDDVFAREMNTVMHDAVHRAITGKFSDPDQEGFTPSERLVPLEAAFAQLERAARAMGLQGEHDLLPRGAPGRKLFASEVVVLRPEGWEAISDEGQEALRGLERDGFAYRGMDAQEYAATVGAGLPVQSRGDWSAEGEGTCFSDAATAESYVNYGRTDPRKTGQPTYLVEVSAEGLRKDRDGYLKTSEPTVPTRVWRMDADEGRIVLRPHRPPVQHREAAHVRQANRALRRRLKEQYALVEPALLRDQGAGTQYGLYLQKYILPAVKEVSESSLRSMLDFANLKLLAIDEAAEYLGLDPKVADTLSKDDSELYSTLGVDPERLSDISDGDRPLRLLSLYADVLQQKARSRRNEYGREQDAQFKVISPSIVQTLNFDAACFLHGRSSGGRHMPWCGGMSAANYRSYGGSGLSRYIVYPRGPERTVKINGQDIPWSPYAFTVSVTNYGDLNNINDPENLYPDNPDFDRDGASDAVALVNKALDLAMELPEGEEEVVRWGFYIADEDQFAEVEYESEEEAWAEHADSAYLRSFDVQLVRLSALAHQYDDLSYRGTLNWVEANNQGFVDFLTEAPAEREDLYAVLDDVEEPLFVSKDLEEVRSWVARVPIPGWMIVSYKAHPLDLEEGAHSLGDIVRDYGDDYTLIESDLDDPNDYDPSWDDELIDVYVKHSARPYREHALHSSDLSLLSYTLPEFDEQDLYYGGVEIWHAKVPRARLADMLKDHARNPDGYRYRRFRPDLAGDDEWALVKSIPTEYHEDVGLLGSGSRPNQKILWLNHDIAGETPQDRWDYYKQRHPDMRPGPNPDDLGQWVRYRGPRRYVKPLGSTYTFISPDPDVTMEVLPETPSGRPQVVPEKKEGSIRSYDTTVFRIAERPVVCKIADTPEKQAQGLQGHPPLTENEGMLFTYASPRNVTFHMGSVDFPIDIVFLRHVPESTRREAMPTLWHGSTEAFSTADPDMSGLGTHLGTLAAAKQRLEWKQTHDIRGDDIGDPIEDGYLYRYELDPKRLLRMPDLIRWDPHQVYAWLVDSNVIQPIPSAEAAVRAHEQSISEWSSVAFDAPSTEDYLKEDGSVDWDRHDEAVAEWTEKLDVEPPPPPEGVWAAIRKALDDAGYDGVVYRNHYEDYGKDSYIVWKPLRGVPFYPDGDTPSTLGPADTTLSGRPMPRKGRWEVARVVTALPGSQDRWTVPGVDAVVELPAGWAERNGILDTARSAGVEHPYGEADHLRWANGRGPRRVGGWSVAGHPDWGTLSEGLPGRGRPGTAAVWPDANSFGRLPRADTAERAQRGRDGSIHIRAADLGVTADGPYGDEPAEAGVARGPAQSRFGGEGARVSGYAQAGGSERRGFSGESSARNLRSREDGAPAHTDVGRTAQRPNDVLQNIVDDHSVDRPMDDAGDRFKDRALPEANSFTYDGDDLEALGDDSPQYMSEFTSGYAPVGPFAEHVDGPVVRSGRLDQLPGGLADDLDIEDFDPDALHAGIEIELEHTDDEDLATEIAMDHLTEDPKYYDKLRKMEAAGQALSRRGTYARVRPEAEVAYQELIDDGRWTELPAAILAEYPDRPWGWVFWRWLNSAEGVEWQSSPESLDFAGRMHAQYSKPFEHGEYIRPNVDATSTHRTANRALRRKLGDRYKIIEEAMALDKGAGTQYGLFISRVLPLLDDYYSGSTVGVNGLLSTINAHIKVIDDHANYLKVNPKLADSIEIDPTESVWSVMSSLRGYEGELLALVREKQKRHGREREAQFEVLSPNVVRPLNFDAACFLHGRSSGARSNDWCTGRNSDYFTSYAGFGKKRYIVYPNGPQETVVINGVSVPWSAYAFPISVQYGKLYNINDPDNNYPEDANFDSKGAEAAVAILNRELGLSLEINYGTEAEDDTYGDHWASRQAGRLRPPPAMLRAAMEALSAFRSAVAWDLEHSTVKNLNDRIEKAQALQVRVDQLVASLDGDTLGWAFAEGLDTDDDGPRGFVYPTTTYSQRRWIVPVGWETSLAPDDDLGTSYNPNAAMWAWPRGPYRVNAFTTHDSDSHDAKSTEARYTELKSFDTQEELIQWIKSDLIEWKDVYGRAEDDERDLERIFAVLSALPEPMENVQKTVRGGQKHYSAIVPIKTDLTGWYEADLEAAYIPLDIELVLWSGSGAEWGRTEQELASAYGWWDRTMHDLQVNYALSTQAPLTLEHELTHMAQTWLSHGKGFIDATLGVPSGKLDVDDYLHDRREREHAIRDIEFFSNLNDEIRTYELARHQGADVLVPELRDKLHEVTPQNWIQHSMFFRKLKVHRPDVWQRAVREFTRAVGKTAATDIHRTANRALRRRLQDDYKYIEEIMQLDTGAGTQYGKWLQQALKELVPYFGGINRLQQVIDSIKSIDADAKYLGIAPKLYENVSAWGGGRAIFHRLRDYEVRLAMQARVRRNSKPDVSEAKFNVIAPNMIETLNFDAACLLHGSQSGSRWMPWCSGATRENYDSYGSDGKRRFIIFPNGTSTTVRINNQDIPWSSYAFPVSIAPNGALVNINDPENQYMTTSPNFDFDGALKAIKILNENGFNVSDEQIKFWRDAGNPQNANISAHIIRTFEQIKADKSLTGRTLDSGEPYVQVTFQTTWEDRHFIFVRPRGANLRQEIEEVASDLDTILDRIMRGRPEEPYEMAYNALYNAATVVAYSDDPEDIARAVAAKRDGQLVLDWGQPGVDQDAHGP